MLKNLTLACALQLVFTWFSYAQTIVWQEDFALPDGTTDDNAPPSQWSVDVTGADLSAGNSYFEVRSGTMEGRNVHGVVIWDSEVIDISSSPNSIITLDVSESGNLEDTDYLIAYYILDGGLPIVFGEQYGNISGGGPVPMTASNLNGTTLQIRIEIGLENGNGERFIFDNVTVQLPADIYSLGNGDWDDNTNWSFSSGGPSCSCIPGFALSPIIENGHTISLTSEGEASSITVENGGVLQWSVGGSTLTLGNDGILLVESGGRINRNGNGNAEIDVSSGTSYTITSNDNINGITLEEFLVSASNLNLMLSGAGFVEVNGDFFVNGSDNTITSSLSSLQILGLLRFNGEDNTFSNSSIMSVGSDILFDASSCGFTNSGTLTLSDDIRIRISAIQDISFVNSGGAIVSFDQLQVNNSPGFSFGNSGTVNMARQFVDGDFPADNTITNEMNATWNYGGANFDADVNLFVNSSGNNFVYNRIGNQDIIPSQSGYYHLEISGTGTKSTSALLTVLSNLNVSSTLGLGNNNLELGGDLVNSGIISNGTNTITLSGGNQSINTGASSLNNLIIDGTSVKTIDSDLDVDGNVTIYSTLDVGSNFQIDLGGDWTNDGLFEQGSGIVVFDGSSDQTIGGSSTSNFNDIQINKAGGTVNNEGTANLLGDLTFQSATQFDADGAGTGVFTLISTASSTGSIAELPAGSSVAGNVTAQRYIPANTKHWYRLSSPVLNAPVSDLQNEILVSGTFTGNDNGIGGIPVNANPSLYNYDETTPGDLNQGYVSYPISSNSEYLTQVADNTEARGYAICIREVESGAVTLDLRGPVNQGAVDFNVTFTDDAGQPDSEDGWNLVGNPYPSSIDWDNAGWTKSGIQGNTIYIWDGIAFQMWNGTSGRAEQGRIAMGQGFHVQTNSVTASLVASESVKTSTDASYFRTSQESWISFELRLTNSSGSDITYFEFNADGSNQFDNLDARKLANSNMDFYSFTADDTHVGINVLPIDFCSITSHLGIEKAIPGTYSIEFSANDIGPFSQINLYDHFEGDVINLLENPNYKFEIADDEDSFNDRFLVELVHSPVTIAYSGNLLTTNFSSGLQWYKDDLPIEGATNPNYEAIESGEYKVIYTSGDCMLESEVISLILTETFAEVENRVSIFPNPTSGILTIKLMDSSETVLELFDLTGRTVHSEKFYTNEHSLNVSDLKPGLYILRISGPNSSSAHRVIKK